MMIKRGLYFLIGGLLYIVVSGIYTSKVVVIAKELKEDVKQLDFDIEDVDLEDSDIEDDKEALQDVIAPIMLTDSEVEEEVDPEPEAEPEEETMTNNNNEFQYMLIFALGAICGVLTGQALFGWIK